MKNEQEQEQANKLSLAIILLDIIDQILVEMHPDTRHTMKVLGGRAIKENRKFFKLCNTILGDHQEDYGDDAEELREVIENHIKNST